MTAPMAPDLAAIERLHETFVAGQMYDCWRDAAYQIAEKVPGLLAEVRRLQAEREGHREPCYYCQEPCNSLAGNPNLWPIALCHADDPGVVKWHHTGCVSSRLVERAAAPPVEQTVEEAIDAHVRAHRNYPTIGDLIPDGMPSSISAARVALLRAITARDAEVARAAAERERTRTLADVVGALNNHESTTGRSMEAARFLCRALHNLDVARSRAPAPAGEVKPPADSHAFAHRDIEP